MLVLSVRVSASGLRLSIRTRSLCRAEYRGGDEEYLIENEYMPSTYGEKDVEEITSEA